MKKILFLFAVVLALASCEPKFEKQYSWAYPVAGDWLITAYDKADTSYFDGPFEMRAYNTSMGTDSIWIDDYGVGVETAAELGNFWTMQFKVAVNMASKTFSATTTANRIPGYLINVVVDNGKIIGNDSIYMEVTFEDDARTFILTGHRETSYDDYMENF